MRISREKKEAAVSYILSKISEGKAGVASHAAESLGVNKSTVHRYIKELTDGGVIEKTAHDRYVLKTKRIEFRLDRNSGDFESDWTAYDRYIHAYLESRPDNVINIWKYVFSEMINNVIDHSGANNAKIVLEQDAVNTTIILLDDGVGIFNKIKSYFNLPSIDDAVSELFKGKLTTDENRHSGEGVFFSSRLMDFFYIFSSKRIFSCNTLDENTIIKDMTDISTGTVVFMRLSNNSKKQAIDVFDKYADIEGGFTRTVIPMKNIFDGVPISRSQANRLCNRLDRFREVTLDFERVEWMGQGFAHQVFKVYAGDHPGIKLIPANMNEKVEKMYNHVRLGEA